MPPLCVIGMGSIKLEQLECLCSEDTPCCPMITHTIDSYWIPSQKIQSQSYKFKEFAKTSRFLIWNKKKNFPCTTPSEYAW